MNESKLIARKTGQIQAVLYSLQSQRYIEIYNQINQYSDKLAEITKESSLLGKSLSRNWLKAADICTDRINRLLGDISHSIERIKQFTSIERKEVPPLRVFAEEIRQLHYEFGSVEYDNKENNISVITEPITLEGIYLGPFEIRLMLDKLQTLYKEPPYYVVALDPHPAATNDEVTHPHVSNERLCEGDGVLTIRSALEQGRLADFFTMIKAILHTYNPDSPFVSVDDWEGTACYDCGYVVNDENRYYCYRCENDYCSECSGYCQQCDESVCLGCGEICDFCNEFACSSCTGRCNECETPVCEGCLEDNLCPNCIEERNKNEQEQNEEYNKEPDKNENADKALIPAGTPVLPNSVGEALVLQRQIG